MLDRNVRAYARRLRMSFLFISPVQFLARQLDTASASVHQRAWFVWVWRGAYLLRKRSKPGVWGLLIRAKS
jgi:hypothetical protein